MPDTSLPGPGSPKHDIRQKTPLPASSLKDSSLPSQNSSPSSLPSSPTTVKSSSDAPKGKGKAVKDDRDSPSSEAKGKSLKRRPSTTALHLEQYITRDHLHAAALISQTEASHDLIRSKRREAEYYQSLRRERVHNPGAIFGYGYQGYGNGSTNGKARILYPCERKRPGARKARELRLTRTQLQSQADLLEALVPIRLDIDYDKIKLRDTFTWNMHDRTVPLELFAEQLVEDFHLPLTPQLVHMVSNSIRDQVTDYHPHIFFVDDPLDVNLPYTAYKNDDMRVLIKLNITIGQHTLVDQFEWDINNPLNSPEEFAQLLTRDLSLSGEFTTAVAHSIREQAQLFTKSLFITGHPFDGRPIEDEDIRSAMLTSPLPSIFRQPVLANHFTPMLYELSDNEMDRAEKSLSREQRRKRRVNRRGGPQLPDLREVPKTHRSQIVSSVLPGAVQEISELKRSMTSKVVKDGESDDDSSESDAEETPPEKAIPGYANMTKRQRIAAQNALRSSTGRSATPEVSGFHRDHHTPLSLVHTHHYPTMTRRPGVPMHLDSALIKLKINKDKLVKLIVENERRDKAKAAQQAAAANAAFQQQQARQPITQQQQQTPAPAAAMMPPATPANASAARPAASPATPAAPSPSPAAPATPATATTPATPARPDASNPDPVPEWLTQALAVLQKSYSQDNFEGMMRQTAYDAADQQVTQAGAGVKFRWMPRIRCHDCPGKLYTPGPDKTVENFLMHLKNRGHRERVDARISKAASKAAASGGA